MVNVATTVLPSWALPPSISSNFCHVDRLVFAFRVARFSLEKLGLNAEQSGTAIAALSLLGSTAVLAVFIERFGGESPPLPTEYDLEQV